MGKNIMEKKEYMRVLECALLFLDQLTFYEIEKLFSQKEIKLANKIVEIINHEALVPHEQ